MKLPGSRPDVVRTKRMSGPSPVGGAYGGTDSQAVMILDDFELQAAHYNMACAHARLGNLDEVRERCDGNIPSFLLQLFFFLFQDTKTRKCNCWCDTL